MYGEICKFLWVLAMKMIQKNKITAYPQGVYIIVTEIDVKNSNI